MSTPMPGLMEALAGELGEALLGVEDGFGPPTADVTPGAWAPALAALAGAGATYFDFLSAVDELDEGFSVVAHVSRPDASEHLLLRTRIPREPASLASATGVYAGAAWHERETAEMFGIDFSGYTDVSGLGLRRLLLPDGFTARPLRKEFVLASRVAKDWPGAKDPADPPGGGPARRKMAPPGVPADWAHEPEPPPSDEPSLPSAASSAPSSLPGDPAGTAPPFRQDHRQGEGSGPAEEASDDGGDA